MPLLFSTFDVFPSAKGSGTHIAGKIRGLKKIFGSLCLAVPGTPGMPRYQVEEGITIRRCIQGEGNFLRRTEIFAGFLEDLLESLERAPEVIHFRDIWSGIPILRHKHSAGAARVFEVNGLPSIELPYHYPWVEKNRGLMNRIKSMEAFCLRNSHYIITVSPVTARYLAGLGINEKKIFVIPNADFIMDEEMVEARDDLKEESPNAREIHYSDGFMDMNHHEYNGTGNYILYAGTLSPWQGLPVLLKAFDYIAAESDVNLEIICSSRKHLRGLRKMADKMDSGDRINIQVGLDRGRLHTLYSNALFTVAPLTRCARNEVQGCSPLKIIESMSAGTPVVASNLSVTRDIIDHGRDGWLVKPDSPRALARGMSHLLSDMNLLEDLGCCAALKIKESHNTGLWYGRLLEAYKIITGRRDMSYE